MKKISFILFFIGCMQMAKAQDLPTTTTVEQQLENQAEADESETEDDSYQQQLQQLLKNPMNLNTATDVDLKVFRSLTDLQIQNFLAYRQLLGKLISIYELQAVPGWDLESIARIRGYVVVSGSVSLGDDLWNRFSGGNHTILLRVAQVLEKSRGFTEDNDSTPPVYKGSQQRIFFRYKYQYKNLLQYGIVGDKDAGEQFFKGAQKNGFDFYSFHVFARNLGIVQRLALGDYTVNLGQGLLTFQSLAFRKSVDVTNIKRQAEIFRPYNSAGEFNFHRGAAITVGNNKWQVSAFFSRKKIGANAVVDSANYEDYISSVLTSGYHRSESEINDRNNINQTAFGGRIGYRGNRLQVGVNAVHYQMSKPLVKDPVPYNIYAFNGKKLTGISIDYGYTWRNIHFFGEAASDQKGSMAHVHGLIASLDPRVDFSLLYRNIAKDYNSLYANAFTETTTPINERGLYTGLSLRPWGFLRLDMYADAYSFPWLKSLADRPSKGMDYVVQLTWKPNKVVEVYTRFKSEKKAANYSDCGCGTPTLPYKETEDIPKQNWRVQASYKVSRQVTLRSRAEVVWYDRKGKQRSNGFLIFSDATYKPSGKISVNARLQYFETDDYNSRIYAYENDVLYSYSIPAFSGKGFRGYFNINYDVTRRITTWFRIARTVYPGVSTVGSGYDEINKNHKTDYRVQVMITL